MDFQCFKGVIGFQSECFFQCDHGCVDRLPVLNPADLKVVMANYSLKRDPYESTYDDFMEVWLQFGHVFLFSSVYPLAGLFALMNNIFEIKVPNPINPQNTIMWLNSFEHDHFIYI